MDIVTETQISERNSWESKLKRGMCTLDQAMSGAMRSGAPMTPYLIECYERAVWQYTRGSVDDLAVPFGIAAGSREKNKAIRSVADSHLRFLVDSFAAPGWKAKVGEGGREIERTAGEVYPKNYPSFDDTAFHAAGERLHMAPSTVFDRYYDSRKKKGALGRN